MPRVSVVVPTYNRGELLRETLPTLLAQTEQDLEIIIADSASTDGTVELVRQSRDTRLRLLSSESPMPHYANWTRAIYAATGEYVALYHDDDLYDPEIVASSRRFLDAHPKVGMVHVGARTFMTGEGDRGLTQAARHDFVRSGRAEALRWIVNCHDVVPSSTMVRRSVYESLDGFEPELTCTADWDFYVRVALIADIGFVAGPLLHVRLHPRSVTNKVHPWRWVEETNLLLDRFKSNCASADFEPPQGWPAAERQMRRSVARRLWLAELSLIYRGEHALASEMRRACLALDSGPLSLALGSILSGCNGPTGRLLLKWVRSIWR